MQMATAHSTQAALKIPRGRSRGSIDYLVLTFAELEAEVGAWANRLTLAGVARGDRTLVMVRQGLPLIASAFALFRIGAVPVLIDPGMGLKAFLSCVRRSQPRALVGIPFAQIVSQLFRPSFRSLKVRVTAARTLTARLTTGREKKLPAPLFPVSAADDLAAVLFTSGSTGAPKGVCFEHGMFDAQVRLIRNTYQIAPGEIDLPLLPIFALFNPAFGVTTIVPEIDPRRPGALDPAKIVQAIRQENVTTSFGSPTLWGKVVAHCRSQNIVLPSLRRVLCAGASVPASLWDGARHVFPNGRLHSPYGATEALPIASIASDEIDPHSTRGACVGSPLPEISVKIIASHDGPWRDFAALSSLPTGQIGEIIVRGPVVTRTYDGLPEATSLAKIAEPASSAGGRAPLWHRMGDCGFLDADGRLWFCGRRAERVETASSTLHTEPCEQVFRRHPRVKRCALIGLGTRGHQRPAMVVEANPETSAAARNFARELRALAQQFEPTREIKLFYFHPKFPVDVRHNAKIHRLTLAQWATTAIGYESDPKR